MFRDFEGFREKIAQTMEQPRRQSTPFDGCKATQEDHLAQKKNSLHVTDDCPICERRGILCRVGCHPTSSVHSVERDLYGNIVELWVGAVSLARSLLSATDDSEEKFLSTQLQNMDSSTVLQNISSNSLTQFSSSQSFPELLPSSATACTVDVIPKISYHTSRSPTNELRQRKVLK